jgi:Na+-driven multidrug efflux pump
VKEAFFISLAIMFTFNFIVIMAMILFPELFASIFTSDKALIAVVKDIMPMFLAGMTIFGLQRACQNTFVALGQSLISLFIALLRKVILLIPLAIILPNFVTPKVNGVFLAEPIADATCAIICTTIFFLNFKKMLSKCEKKEP